MSNVFRLYLSGVLVVSVASEATCYVEDMRILGSSETLINNVITCSNAVASSAGGITDCMMDVYPSYGLVSGDCLDCTTAVMQADSGLHCLPNCIDHPTSSDCTACIPNVLADFVSRCEQGVVGPRDASTVHSGTAENACSASDVENMRSAEYFVGNSLGCMTNLADLQTCIYDTIPHYADISLSCKTCIGARSTTDAAGAAIATQDCGALCMQQGGAAADCAVCTAGLVRTVDVTCLGNSAWSSSIIFALAVVVVAIVN
jgi:hypothetical protein